MVIVDSKKVDGKQLLYTGGKTKIYKNDQLHEEFINIVRGDTNGDAVINSADLLGIISIQQKIDLIIYFFYLHII